MSLRDLHATDLNRRLGLHDDARERLAVARKNLAGQTPGYSLCQRSAGEKTEG